MTPNLNILPTWWCDFWTVQWSLNQSRKCEENQYEHFGCLGNFGVWKWLVCKNVGDWFSHLTDNYLGHIFWSLWNSSHWKPFSISIIITFHKLLNLEYLHFKQRQTSSFLNQLLSIWMKGKSTVTYLFVTSWCHQFLKKIWSVCCRFYKEPECFLTFHLYQVNIW